MRSRTRRSDFRSSGKGLSGVLDREKIVRRARDASLTKAPSTARMIHSGCVVLHLL
jgi:hypothetical protein